MRDVVDACLRKEASAAAGNSWTGMKNLYAVPVTLLALFVTLIWVFIGPLSLVALVGWVGRY